MTRPRLKIAVSGMIAGDPFQGGATWAVLQYVLGLRELGHCVTFVEPVEPTRMSVGDADEKRSAASVYFREVVSDFDLAADSSLLVAGTRVTIGLPYEELLTRFGDADLLLNISGMLADTQLLDRVGVRVFLDLDPAFIQCWSDQGIDMRFQNHTHFATIGLAIGEAHCPIPTCGLPWIKTLQPIVLAHWPVADRLIHDGLTTVGHWRGYGSIEHQGVRYGQKAHSFRQFCDLPRRTSEAFLVALAIDAGETADIAMLKRGGWRRLDPLEVAGTPHFYQQFVQGSKAELGIAKSGYVESRSGWFSDRSLCYLASGRPVIAQETGFSRRLPTGEGLFAFQTADDVLTAIESINVDYDRHRRAAREIAESEFDSRKVLPRLLNSIGAFA